MRRTAEETVEVRSDPHERITAARPFRGHLCRDARQGVLSAGKKKRDITARGETSALTVCWAVFFDSFFVRCSVESLCQLMTRWRRYLFLCSDRVDLHPHCDGSCDETVLSKGEGKNRGSS